MRLRFSGRPGDAVARRRVIVAAAWVAGVAGVAGLALVPSTSQAARSPVPVNRTCGARLDGDFRVATRTVSLGDSSPWSAARGGSVDTALVRRSDRRIVLCSGEDTIDARIRLRRGDELARVAVADPWLTWITTRHGRQTIHRRRIDAPHSHTRTRRIRGQATTVLVTTNGTTVLTDRSGRRVARYFAPGGTRQLKRVTRALARGTARRRLVLWGTRQIAVIRGTVTEPFDARTGRPITACDPGARGVPLRTTPTGTFALADGTAWAPSSASSTIQLTLCNPSGRRLASRALYAGNDIYTAAPTVAALAGPVLLTNTWLFDRNAGSSVSVTTRHTGYVLDPGTPGGVRTISPTVAVSSPAGSAYIENNALYVNDADGLRRLAFPGPLNKTNTRLDIRGAALLVRTPETTRTFALQPLPTGTYAAATAGDPGRDGPFLASDDLCGITSPANGQGCLTGGGPPGVSENPNG